MITGSIAPLDIDISAIFGDTLSPEARSATLAEFANEALSEADQNNTGALGFTPTHNTTVDGIDGASENDVKPDGTIIYTFDILSDVFSWISSQLQAFAPVRSGAFRDSFEFFVDGVLTVLTAEIPPGKEYTFLSSEPYAGKIEGETRPPESRQAPNGVFEAVATLALQKFSQLAISFAYRVPFPEAQSTSKDTPAITITVGS